jgi:two-component system cell cycle sensor histidine kinase/response regulator CckA
LKRGSTHGESGGRRRLAVVLNNSVSYVRPGGAFSGYTGSCIDITRVKGTKEEDVLKQKLETVGTLAGGIAHDFNNVLSTILAYSELALAELVGGSTPIGEFQKIRTAAIHGAEIVRQLMIYAGEEESLVELVDVSGIVEDMLELLRVSVSKHVTVETDFDRHLPPVRGSSSQIRQLVMNLITNASDAMGDRDGLIRLSTRRATISRDQATSGRLVAGDYVELEVADTGPGMTAEMRARVFDPFFTTKIAGRHGLGLAVVQGIVSSLHGAIQVWTAPGKGTTFQILLPSEDSAQPAAGTVTGRAHEETLRVQGATVLIVEDEEGLRQAVTKILRRKGLSVIEACNGSAALDAIRAHRERIDLLFLDITLPGASSRQVLEEAKHLRRAMPVIVTSAKSQETAAVTLAVKIDHFLRKPYRLGDLIQMIQDTLLPEAVQSYSVANRSA